MLPLLVAGRRLGASWCSLGERARNQPGASGDRVRGEEGEAGDQDPLPILEQQLGYRPRRLQGVVEPSGVPALQIVQVVGDAGRQARFGA